MKQNILLAIILMTTCAIATAQPRAIGGRIGWGVGASYQHSISEKNMIQADLDILCYYEGVQGTVTYNWLFPITSWNGGDFNFFTGVGIGGGYDWSEMPGTYRCWGGISPPNGIGFVGVAGNVGLEVNFQFGLQLSLDFRPLVAPYFAKDGISYFDDGTQKKGNGGGYYLGGLVRGAFGLGVRYKFGG